MEVLQMATEQRYRDDRVNVKVVLAASWVAMLFVFAYVDVLALFRADVLRSALDGQVKGLGLAVNQGFLAASLIYVLIPILMVVMSLLLAAPVNRVVNVAVSLVYAVTVAVSCIGETWAYYLVGSGVEIALLLFIARTARNWPRDNVVPRSPAAGAEEACGVSSDHVGAGREAAGV
jgi:hypothetical protein